MSRQVEISCEKLQIGWGNPGYSADLDYLEAVSRMAIESAGPILECGTGLTTILLGLLTRNRDVCVHSLEHDAAWHRRVTTVARKLGLNRLHIHFAPLIDYGGYWWYQPPFNWMSKHFSLVICDGPQESTPGGRYGLLPIMRERLDCGALVLLDDANTLAGSKVLDRWRSEWGASVELIRNPNGEFAVVKIG